MFLTTGIFGNVVGWRGDFSLSKREFPVALPSIGRCFFAGLPFISACILYHFLFITSYPPKNKDVTYYWTANLGVIYQHALLVVNIKLLIKFEVPVLTRSKDVMDPRNLTSISCRWQTRATRCITPLQTKVGDQCDKLATELCWQLFQRSTFSSYSELFVEICQF